MILSVTEGLSPGVMAALVFGLVLIAVAGVMHALFDVLSSGTSRATKRLRMLAVGEVVVGGAGGVGGGEQRRKQSIEKALGELAARERAKQQARMTLKMRLSQAGLEWTSTGYWVRIVGFGLVSALLVRILTEAIFPISVGAGAMLGYLGVNAVIVQQRSARMRQFLEEFPNAIDVIIRGVKTGLPLGDCLKAIAMEGQEPVRTEFQRLVDDVAVGITLGQALTRFTQRVPILEANFFAVVITIQSQLGGNLSEALGNLSRVLRERKMMKEKIRAFSSEATASGAIIASMPVVVGFLLFLTSPDYIGLMFSTRTGNMVLGGCAVWMLIGVGVMRKMIRFDY